jgi:hypothetical protein
MPCGACGVTARLAGVFCLRLELVFACYDVFGWGDICFVVVFATLGGETVVFTLGGAAFSTPSVGGSQLLISVVWRLRKYWTGVSKLSFVRRRPYKISLPGTDVIGHE